MALEEVLEGQESRRFAVQSVRNPSPSEAPQIFPVKDLHDPDACCAQSCSSPSSKGALCSIDFGNPQYIAPEGTTLQCSASLEERPS